MTSKSSPEPDTDLVSYQDDPVGYERRLRAKLTPAAIRSTMEFAALYQMTGEMTRYAVIDEVRQFFANSFEDGRWIVDQHEYKAQVLDRDKSAFTASLGWLVSMDAISQAQANRLGEVHAHRNELTHELVLFVIDPDAEPDIAMFTDAIAILKAIRRFWTQIEANIGTFDEIGDVDLDEIVPLSLIVLQQCLDAYLDGLSE